MADDLLRRLNSFMNWPPEFASISPVVLALAGFMYTGNRDRVTCPVCGIEIEGWQINRLLDPKNEHRMRSPKCSLVSSPPPESNLRLPTPSQASYLQKIRGSDSSMVSFVTTSSASANNEMSTSTSSTGPVNSKPFNDRIPVGGASNHVDETLNKKQTTRTQIDKNIPDLNRLKVERSRLETYSAWPATAPVNPSDLAKTGLFYTGANDRVRCVFCGGILHNWTTDDVPAFEHRRHFPDCPFIRGLDVGNVPLETNKNVRKELDQRKNINGRNSGHHVTCIDDDECVLVACDTDADLASHGITQSCGASSCEHDDIGEFVDFYLFITSRGCYIRQVNCL